MLTTILIGLATVIVWASLAFGISFSMLHADKTEKPVKVGEQVAHWWATFWLVPIIGALLSIFVFFACLVFLLIGSFMQWLISLMF